MKIDRHGRAKILTQDEIQLLFNSGFTLNPLRVIQEISGHRTLDELYKYLEVKPEQVIGAIASLSMLTPRRKLRLLREISVTHTIVKNLPL